MSRYIDAGEMLEYLNLMYDKQYDSREPYNVGVLGAINYIKHKAPSIDIVRCKECRHWHSGNCWGIPFSGDDASYIETESNDFCSYGER